MWWGVYVLGGGLCVSAPLKSALELVVEATGMSPRTCCCGHFRDQSSQPN